MIIGSTIDPSLLVNDYSGFAKAGEIRGQATAQLGKDIAGAAMTGMSMYKDMKAQEGQMNAFGKSMDSMAKAFPAQAEFYNQAKAGIFDPNASMIERVGRMNGYQSMMQNLFTAQSQDNANKLLALKLGASGGAGGADAKSPF